MHYAKRTRDRANHLAQIAEHVGIPHPPEVREATVPACGVDAVRANAARYAPGVGQALRRAEAGLFDSGTSHKWEGTLSDAARAAWDARMADLLPDPAERAWLEWGAAGA